MTETEKHHYEWGYDQGKDIRYRYVQIKNPIILGMQIAIGMFIVFPLFLFAMFVLFIILGGSLGGL